MGAESSPAPRMNVFLPAAAQLIFAAIGALIVWAAGGAVAALAFFALVVILLFFLHLRQIAALMRWLGNPGEQELPRGSGIWDEIYSLLYRFLRQHRTSRSKLTATLNDFQKAGAAMPDGLVILDQTDRIEWCNPKAERHLGLDRSRDTGQQISYLVRHPEFTANLGTHDYSKPLTLRGWRGTNLVLSVQIVPYGDQQKLIVSRDVTEMDRLETMRRDFIANVSHELRTPLTVLSGFLETIDGVADRQKAIARALPLMSDQTRRMHRLVEDLLALSRLESGANSLREDLVNVPDVVRGLYHDALALSGGRHRITLELGCELQLQGSEDELRSAFGNLVSNAVRYTPDGGEVTISWLDREGQPVFVVRDTGIGIDQTHIPRLTERFYRVDRSRSRETGGTGLGLAIVKHVLNRHQARLEVSSELAKGSAFVVVFPKERGRVPSLPGEVAVTA